MILYIIEIVISVLLVGIILMQVQGTGLSGSFGGANESFRSKQGMEKTMVYATVVIAVIFALVSILLVIPR